MTTTLSAEQRAAVVALARFCAQRVADMVPKLQPEGLEAAVEVRVGGFF